jgi:predicted 2-oxoglutarate/Fe(II)-dependent dioxygenase YbiX
MKTALADNLFTVAGLLSPDECRDLIERGEALGFQRAAVRTRSGPQMRADIRDNDRIEFTDLELAALLWQRCLPFVSLHLEEGEAVGLDEGFRFYRYDVGQRFKQHRDGVVQRSAAVRTRLSFLVYLNEGFTGGETVFYGNERLHGVRPEVARVSPQTGAGLFFLHEWVHEALPLEAGRKYVLRSDVFYRFADAPLTSPQN